ncbi:synaptic vesicle glycoprotein 2B isoform X1 [Nasonia vitripennis]|uniref:Major facilitator superfamily (MFS) profile domain-containing protein n=2 Tax=Nasonia vitripennis TaxID=7425 RepID=A0A7M7PVW3_NASVI|nr:synaptic vesicle glycoprotein 2B isoform X1 [Nasonia vitripennis]
MGSRNDQPVQTVELDSTVKHETPRSKAADFEEAVAATGYGKFHYLLYLAIIPASWSSSFDTSTTSMIIPSTECDLNLTLFQKGVLNAIVYAGMVSSALMWGFIADAFGRKPIVFYGYLIDGILNVLSGFSQSFYVLAIFKFLSGFVVSGPYASVMTYCAEFHCTKDRPKITMLVGVLITAGSIIGASLALLIIPQDWSFSIGNYIIRSWQIYLIFCGVPILFGTTCLSFFPESPKFLMSQGRNDEALEVFKTIYSVNSGKSKESYPIQFLENETAKQSTLESNETLLKPKSLKECVHEGMLQMKPLFMGSFFARLMLVVTIQFCGMLSTNTIRLWQPQLFAILAESDASDLNSDFSFCSVIDQSTFTRINESITKSIVNASVAVECIQKTVENSVYTNTIIISASSLFFCVLAGILVSLINNKLLLLISYSVAICSVLALNWTDSVILTLIAISLFVGCLSASVNLVISIVVNLFPTTMRTMAVSLTMMTGRIGSLIGNIMFPIFLEYGCIVALLCLTALVSASFILTIFIPKPKENVK